MIPPLAKYVFIMSTRLGQDKGEYKKWEDWEKNYLKTYYPKKGMNYCAKHLSRTPETVQQMARRLRCCVRGYFADKNTT